MNDEHSSEIILAFFLLYVEQTFKISLLPTLSNPLLPGTYFNCHATYYTVCIIY